MKQNEVNVSSYKKPCNQIMNILDKNIIYHTSISPNSLYIIHARLVMNPSVAVLSKPRLRLAGYEVDAGSGISTEINAYDHLYITARGSDQKIFEINGNIRLFAWNFASTKALFVLDKYLHYVDIHKAQITKIDIELNMFDSHSYEELSADQIIMVGMGKWNMLEPIDHTMPKTIAPVMEENKVGKKNPKRTIPNLLKTPSDKLNFRQLVQSVLYVCDLNTNESRRLTDPFALKDFSCSVSGKYMMYEKYTELSSIVDLDNFGYEIHLHNFETNHTQLVEKIKLDEDELMIKDATKKVGRCFSWTIYNQSDAILWLKPNDEGNPKIDVEFRDTVMVCDQLDNQIELNKSSHSVFQTEYRCKRIQLDFDNNFWITSVSQKDRKCHIHHIDLINNTQNLIFSYELDDLYNNPGRFATMGAPDNQLKIYLSGRNVWMINDGFSKNGVKPYLYTINLDTKNKQIIWKSSDDAYQRPSGLLNIYPQMISLIYSSETSTRSKCSYLYHIRDSQKPSILNKNESYSKYFFLNQNQKFLDHSISYDTIASCPKEMIRYKRSDGVELSATLYLPLNYNPNQTYPVLIWAYPEEYHNKDLTGQIRSSDMAFEYVTWASPLFWLAKGYVVVDDCDMPILTPSNISLVDQLIMNSEAIINLLKERGLSDGSKIAVGGHSFGSFMVANLLTHSKLFTTGIARSGAYNRTLTPFGFQFEDKYYWDVPDTYNAISPFCHADKIDTPILLIHGMADSNPGTFPIQSERYYEALRGLGKEASLLLLPYEDHSYTGKESIEHMLAVCDEWLDRWMR